MTEYEKIWSFQNLYRANKAARLGKRDTKEVIEFELRLAENLTRLSDSLRSHSYQLSGYYSFYVHDPKERKIHALHYVDRVVQHCLCDEVLAPLLDKRLIYDNAACRIGKGTHFAIERTSGFLREFYRRSGIDGWILKCDIRKFFDSIDHNILKEKLKKVITDEDVLWLLFLIIDSFSVSPGKGLPMGNQTSQWFAVFYLDGFDRLIKEKLQIRYYSRYMDDAVLICQSREYLKSCLKELSMYLESSLLLQFNGKTQIFPVRNGVDYLGWHLYLTESGKVIRKVRRNTKEKFRRKLKYFEYAYPRNLIELEKIEQVLNSYYAHLAHGHTDKLERQLLRDFKLIRDTEQQE